MKRICAKWMEPDPPNTLPRGRIILSPSFKDVESKQEAIKWLANRLAKEPFATPKSIETKIIDE